MSPLEILLLETLRAYEKLNQILMGIASHPDYKVETALKFVGEKINSLMEELESRSITRLLDRGATLTELDWKLIEHFIAARRKEAVAKPAQAAPGCGLTLSDLCPSCGHEWQHHYGPSRRSHYPHTGCEGGTAAAPCPCTAMPANTAVSTDVPSPQPEETKESAPERLCDLCGHSFASHSESGCNTGEGRILCWCHYSREFLLQEYKSLRREKARELGVRVNKAMKELCYHCFHPLYCHGVSGCRAAPMAPCKCPHGRKFLWEKWKTDQEKVAEEPKDPPVEERKEPVKEICSFCRHPVDTHNQYGCCFGKGGMQPCPCKYSRDLLLQLLSPKDAAVAEKTKVSTEEPKSARCLDCGHLWSDHRPSGCTAMKPLEGGVSCRCFCQKREMWNKPKASPAPVAEKRDEPEEEESRCPRCHHPWYNHTSVGCCLRMIAASGDEYTCHCLQKPEARAQEPEETMCPVCTHPWADHRPLGGCKHLRYSTGGSGFECGCSNQQQANTGQ